MRVLMRVGRNERLHKIFIIHDRPASKGAAPDVPAGPVPQAAPAGALSARGIGPAGSTPPKTAGQVEPAGEFRVLTKEKLDGTLELLGYHYRFDGEHEHQSNVLRAPSVPAGQLLPIIRRLVTQTHTDIRQMQVVDLTTLRTRLDQADRLAQNELLDAFDFE
jgi:hypothetical protein